jgi:hypothetical protein
MRYSIFQSQEYRVLEPISGSAATAIVIFDPTLGKAVELV